MTVVIIGAILLLGALLAGPGRRAAAYALVALSVMAVLAVRPGPVSGSWVSVLVLLALGLAGAEALHRLVVRERASSLEGSGRA